MVEKKATILIVDDEELIRTAVLRKLESEGYKCKTASNGQEALEIASKQQFDLVLSDIRMPIMSGL